MNARLVVRASFVLSLLSATVSPVSAFAAAPARPLSQVLTGAAKDDYEAAKLVYSEGDYVTAAIKFRRAYDVSHDPRLLWNIAACEKGARHYTKALALVERYELEGAGLLTEADRREAQGFAAALRATTDTLTITANVSGAVVLLDGVSIGKTPIAAPVRVDLGDRRLQVSKVGYQPFEQVVSFTGKGVALGITLAEVIHEGTLRVDADLDATIAVDGRLLATGGSSVKLVSGAHNVRITAKGKKTYDSDVLIEDGQTNNLRVRLESDRSGVGAWPWIVGGAVIIAGGAIAAYLIVHENNKTSEGSGISGTLGTIQLGTSK
jgi:hypothetical protein